MRTKDLAERLSNAMVLLQKRTGGIPGFSDGMHERLPHGAGCPSTHPEYSIGAAMGRKWNARKAQRNQSKKRFWEGESRKKEARAHRGRKARARRRLFAAEDRGDGRRGLGREGAVIEAEQGGDGGGNLAFGDDCPLSALALGGRVGAEEGHPGLL